MIFDNCEGREPPSEVTGEPCWFIASEASLLRESTVTFSLSIILYILQMLYTPAKESSTQTVLYCVT